MQENRRKTILIRYNNPSTRFVIILFAIVLLAGIWYFAGNRISNYKNQLYTDAKDLANISMSESKILIDEMFRKSKSNVIFLSGLVEEDLHRERNLMRIEKKFHDFLQVYTIYFKVRYLDSMGVEVINLELNQGSGIMNNLSETLPPKLPNYFLQSKDLDSGSVYISPLDLYNEGDFIQDQIKPTIRFFTPVYIDSVFHGVVGLNLDATNWFHPLEHKNVIIVNSKNQIYTGKDLNGDQEYNFQALNEFGYDNYISSSIIINSQLSWRLYVPIEISHSLSVYEQYRYVVYTTSVAATLLLVLLLSFLNYAVKKRNEHILKLSNKNEELTVEIENRKYAEEELRHTNETLSKYIEEKNTLLKEVHHRVKNNLQIIMSLMNLQTNTFSDEVSKTVFQYLQMRIASMALVHEMLFQTENLSKIDFYRYINTLTNRLIQSLHTGSSKIHFKLDAPNVEFSMDTAIPLGLLINEIVTNAIKHGFKSGENGEITIELKEKKFPEYSLIIGDNGSGFENEPDFENSKTLGLKLIKSLATQLEGDIRIETSEKGTFYILNFKDIGK